MTLRDWLRNGWLTEHRTSREEMVQLATDLRHVVARWLRENYPSLLARGDDTKEWPLCS